MNVKQWGLFFIVTLSVNYVSATFLPHRHGSHHRRRDSYTECNRGLRGYLSTRIEEFRGSFQNKYGRQCSLGNRRLEGYGLRNVRAKGFHNFGLGESCQCNVENDGRIFIRFALTFKEVVASFLLDVSESKGGIFKRFSETIFGIIGYFADQFLQIVFPEFLCNVVVVGDEENGFSLSDFEFLEPEDNIGFLGGLSRHSGRLNSYTHWFFEPLEYCFRLFLTDHFRPFLGKGIGEWEFDEDVFSRSRLGLGGGSGGGYKVGGKSGGSRRGGGSEEEDTEGGSGHGRKSGGWSGGKKTSGSGGYEEEGGGSYSSEYTYEYED